MPSSKTVVLSLDAELIWGFRDHDIEFHSFSQIELGKQDVSKGVAQAELKKPGPKLQTG